MWPWEHLAVGYLCYALLAHARGRRVTEAAALAVAFGTQFPDLVDKPLSWSLNLLPAGIFAHSLLVAVPVAALAVLIARGRGRTDAGLGFAVGYLSHLPADAFPPVLFGEAPSWWMLFWPVTARPGSAPVSDPILGPGAGAGILSNVEYYFGDYLTALLGPRAWLYVGAELLLVGAAVAVWWRDGRPGLATVRGVLRRRRSDSAL